MAEIYTCQRGFPDCTKITAVGESAGAYIVSLAARKGAHADGYILLGAFCGKAALSPT